jgi:hypothetical protein
MAGMLEPSAPQHDSPDRLRARALDVVSAERYLVLATSSRDGTPWSSPVWFAHDGLAAFYWLSRPYRTHSVNLQARPRVAFVVFDSRQPAGTGLGVYAVAEAGVVPDEELDAALAVLSPRSVAHGGSEWTRERLEPLPTQLYVARPVELSLLPGVGTDERVPVPLE